MSAALKPTHWIDILPALALARGVPYVATWAPFTSKKPYRGVGGDLGPDLMKLNSDPKVRIDLDDPAGMGYALRLLAQHPEPASWSGAHGWVWRHLRGNTTDADRVALAKALAKVMS